MKRVFALYRYMLWETVKPVVVFYSIFIAVLAGAALLYQRFGSSAGEFNGLEISSTIFLFVMGLNSFKSSFIFASANGFTRGHYYRSAVLSLLTVATAMSVIDAALGGVASMVRPNLLSGWGQFYPANSWVDLWLWHWAMNVLAVGVGLLITLAFYRVSKVGKVLLGLTPVWLSLWLSGLNSLLGEHRLSNWLNHTFLTLMGMGEQPNALIGALSMAVGGLALLALCRLMMRRAPVKEQER